MKKSVGRRLEKMPEPVLELEAELTSADLTMETLDRISALEPFGKGNPFPKFAMFGAPVAEARKIGDAKQHLRLRIGENPRRAVTAVAWNREEEPADLGTRIDAAFEMSRNEWQGRVDVQLILEDLRPAEGESQS